MSLNKITPQDILEIVKFNIEKDNNWRYDKDNKDMYAYQAEGSAGLWNRLEYYGLAILADEVGMGKTYQALAVLAQQFYKNSDSKILIVTPRIEVLRQWKKEEYSQFQTYHLKDSSLMPSHDELDTLQNLLEGFNPNNKKIIFAKTTSFSQNIDIEKCKKSLKDFDLVIVDEVHQYRNFNIDSNQNNNRTSNAYKIFKENKTKILFMTATPLHSKKSDILNIANVFKSKIFEEFSNKLQKTPESIMNQLMVRRLRVMAKGLNKYDYREENEIAVDLKTENNDYKNELFFAMLQKQIIQESTKINFSKSKHLLDLLEGTTFDKNFNEENSKEEDSNNLEKIFTKVVEKFQKSYGLLPSNQKYNRILDEIWNSEEKALVFVRRRASAVELSRQYMEEFDKRAWKLLSNNSKIPSRERFDDVLGLKDIDNKVEIFLAKKYIDEYFEEYKRYIELPKGTRDKTIKKNMANNFFDMYDEINKNNLEKFIKKIQEKETLEDTSIVKSKVLDFFKTKSKEDSTSASRFVRKFDKGREYEMFFTDFLPNYLKYEEEKIGLIKSAILHASIGVIELYKCDIKTKNYDSFCKKVGKIIDNSTFKKEINNFLQNFAKYEKYLILNNSTSDSEKEEEEVVKVYDETIFYNAQPTYSYLSNTKNKSVIARFNSPFFPNLLCGTSTLQEGLNLHLQCNKVYHFGSAHSMGDDEQRTGRVDRIHGKMYRELESDSKEKKLHIYYPYLKNTFDEENLRKMLCSKRNTEKKIDKCLIEVNIEKNSKIITNNECEKPIDQLISKGNRDSANDTEPFGWEMK